MITVSEERAVDFESTAQIATEAFGSSHVKFSPQRMKWLYQRGFGQGCAVVAAFDGDKKVGQIVMLHQEIYLEGEPVIATQLIDLFVLPAYRSPTLVRRIYDEVARLCEANHIRIVLTLPNEKSAPLNARLLKMRPFLLLAVRVGLSFGPPRRGRLQLSAAIKTMSRDDAIDRLSPFATPTNENGPHWEAAPLLDRISDPTRDYAVHATRDLLLVSSSRKTRGINHVLLCGFFARPGAVVTSGDISTLIRAACQLWKHRVFVYAGINNSLPRPPGVAIPARYRQPILVQLRDVHSDKVALSFDRFQLIDSDFV
jgi:predicted N-acetyltransferase YhbS